MLILSRKAGERVVIDGGIEVEILQVRGDRVKIGFVAPLSVTIHRKEIQEIVDKEQGK
jgi:carbon storage regulator